MSDFDDFYLARHEAQSNQPRGQEPAEAQPEATPLLEKDLMKDPQFIRDSWTWYNATKAGEKVQESRGWRERGEAMLRRGMEKKPIVDDKDVTEWAVRSASSFNNNLAQMVVDWQDMRKRPIGELKAMLNVIEMYDQTDTDSRQVGRALVNMGSDPFSVFGISMLGKAAAKGMSGPGVKSYMRSMVSKSLTNPVVVGMGEGAAIGGATGAVQEDLESTAQQRDYNAIVPMIYTGVGAALGGTIGGATMGFAQIFKGWRGGPDGATITDSKAVADSFGDSYQKEITAMNPIFFAETVTADEFSEKLDLDEDQTAQIVSAIGGDARTKVPTHQFVLETDVQDALNFREVDMVGYPENVPHETLGETAQKEIEDPGNSLDREGFYMTYRQIGGIFEEDH